MESFAGGCSSTFVSLFPAGSIDFDCALVMRNIAHEWEPAAAMYVEIQSPREEFEPTMSS
jgi:hypothetical protein